MPGSAAPAGGVSATRTRWPSPCAATLHPASGLGSTATVAAIGAPQRGWADALAATGSASVRSTPSGMQVSLQTSQSARAAIASSLPGFASEATVSVEGSRISPSKP